MVVVPHGGPHAVTISAYFHSYAFLCVSYGLALLHVNYRGSTGFGSAALARYVFGRPLLLLLLLKRYPVTK